MEIVGCKRVIIANTWFHCELIRNNVDFKVDRDLVIFIGEQSEWHNDFDFRFIYLSSYYLRREIDFTIETIERIGAARIIIFNSWQPLVRELIKRHNITKFELWEDGISHYCDVYNKTLHYRNTLAKLVLGTCDLSLFSRGLNIEGLKRRNRFIESNLTFEPFVVPFAPTRYFVGQPLVESKLINFRKYRRIVQRFADAGFVYLPHPREKFSYSDTISVQKYSGPAELFLSRSGCSELVSVFSSLNLNVLVEKNVLMPSFIGNSTLSSTLKRLPLPANVSII